MYLMAVDIGNTNVVIGIFQDDKIIYHWRISSKVPRTEDEFWIFVNSLFQTHAVKIGEISYAIISSVVPDLTQPFMNLMKKYFKVDPLVVDADLDTGLKLLVDNPASVGADRICNCVAGFQKYGGPLVVLDFGTATTFDVVTKKCEFIGGIIAPGIEMTATILHQLAAKLPKVELKFPKNVVGKNTETNIQAGLMYGTVELIDGLIRRIEEELNEKVKVVATGGLADVVSPHLKTTVAIEPDLTLLGMRLIFERLS
ncbi:MAG: type III pantothenate kinase [Calditrichaeota bacterium]|nr:type III pantothenate kinase [Calditrichota bacterium]